MATKVVTMVGIASYTLGLQKWKGAAETLKILRTLSINLYLYNKVPINTIYYLLVILEIKTLLIKILL